MADSTELKIVDLLRKDLQDTLNIFTGGQSIGVEKYWQYIGRINLTKQICSRLNHKVFVNVVINPEGGE